MGGRGGVCWVRNVSQPFLNSTVVCVYVVGLFLGEGEKKERRKVMGKKET